VGGGIWGGVPGGQPNCMQRHCPHAQGLGSVSQVWLLRGWPHPQR